MQKPNSYHQPPRRSPIVVGLLTLGTAILIFGLPIILFYVVLYPCGDSGCHTVINPARPTATPNTNLILNTDIGRKLTYDQKELLVTKVVRDSSYGKVTADEGYQLVAINLSVTDLTSKALDISTSDFDVLDSDGDIYPYIKDGKTPVFGIQPDGPTYMASGWLTFQVPKNASGLILQYRLRTTNASPIILEVLLHVI